MSLCGIHIIKDDSLGTLCENCNQLNVDRNINIKRQKQLEIDQAIDELEQQARLTQTNRYYTDAFARNVI